MKRFSIYIFAAMLSFALANFAFAAEWRLTVKTKSGDLVYIDQSSILDSGAEKTITVKSNIVEGERSPASYELKYLINCSSKEVALIASTKYNAIDLMGDGQVLKISNPPKKSIATEGGVFDYYLKAVCVDKSTAKPLNDITQTGRSLPANWRLIFKTNSAEIFIDQSSIPSAGTEKTILVKSNEVQGERSPSSLELKYQVNCAANEVAVIGAKQYKSLDLQGDAMTLNTSNPPKFIEGKPGSNASAIVKAACVDQSTTKSANDIRQSPQQQTQTTNSGDQIPKAINFLKRPKNWRQVTTARQQTTTVFLANEEFYKTNNQTLVANVLFDYSQPQGDGSRSSVFTLYLNCSAPQKSFRLAQVKHYSEYAGRGRILGRETINESAQLIPEYDGYGFKRLWDEISWNACNSVKDIQRVSMPSFEEAQQLLNVLETVGQKQYNDYQIADEKTISSERIAYERKPYGEKQNLPTPFNTVSSAGELVAACVAATLAFEETAKGTNYNTREARIWGGTAIRAKDQFPDPNFNPWIKKWFNQLKTQPASINLILFERCKRDFPAGAENTGFIR